MAFCGLLPSKDDTLPSAVGRSCGLFWLVFTIVAWVMSFSALEEGKFALVLNWSTQKIDDEVQVVPGLRFLGLGNMLLEFPAAKQTMYFVRDLPGACEDDYLDAGCHELVRPLVYVRSKDGLEMEVSVSFQWRLNASDIHDLYKNFGWDMYKDEFVSLARSSIVEACSKATAEVFYTSRETIKDNLYTILFGNFNRPDLGIKVDISDVQLREVYFPGDFESELTRTQLMLQEVEIAKAEREEKVISLSRNIVVATERVDELITQANGVADKVRLENDAFVTQLLEYQRKIAVENAAVLRAFDNATDPFSQLFEIMRIKAVREHHHMRLLLQVS